MSRRNFALAALSLCGYLSSSAMAADHGDAPGVRLDTRLDINDVYVFQSPENAANTVIAVTTNPVAGITGPLTYNPEAEYEILIDNNGDAREDVVFQFRFKGQGSDTAQRYTAVRTYVRQERESTVVRGTTNSTVPVTGGGQVIASVFDDPFFFDLLAFRNGLAFSQPNAKNFFKGLNTLAIVLEVPSATLTSNNSTTIGVWARTVFDGRQVDRMGRPAINTVLVKSANKDVFNRSAPRNDERFRADAVEIITSLGNSPATAQALSEVLFPDILTFDTANAGGFLNGRRLEDDVIDAELQLLTGNPAASDFVASDSAFTNTFPYLAPKNP